MANITIYLSVDEVGHLHLRDSEGHSGEDNITTDAKDGDTIIWTLEPENPGISAITGIAKKEDSQDLFSEGPAKVSDTEWSGTISLQQQEKNLTILSIIFRTELLRRMIHSL